CSAVISAADSLALAPASVSNSNASKLGTTLGRNSGAPANASVDDDAAGGAALDFAPAGAAPAGSAAAGAAAVCCGAADGGGGADAAGGAAGAGAGEAAAGSGVAPGGAAPALFCCSGFGGSGCCDPAAWRSRVSLGDGVGSSILISGLVSFS